MNKIFKRGIGITEKFTKQEGIVELCKPQIPILTPLHLQGHHKAKMLCRLRIKLVHIVTPSNPFLLCKFFSAIPIPLQY